jgi:2-amino-4-ketopentanoate thiolase alpha subunit
VEGDIRGGAESDINRGAKRVNDQVGRDEQAQQGQRTWVEIGFVVLEPTQRTAHIPDDTRRQPYYARVKGFVDGRPQVGDEVEVSTILGRRVKGKVLRIAPQYGYGFGGPIKELMEAGQEARALLRELRAEA